MAFMDLLFESMLLAIQRLLASRRGFVVFVWIQERNVKRIRGLSLLCTLIRVASDVCHRVPRRKGKETRLALAFLLNKTRDAVQLLIGSWRRGISERWQLLLLLSLDGSKSCSQADPQDDSICFAQLVTQPHFGLQLAPRDAYEAIPLLLMAFQ